MLLKVSRSVPAKLGIFSYTWCLKNIQKSLIVLPGCILAFVRIGVTVRALNKKMLIFLANIRYAWILEILKLKSLLEGRFLGRELELWLPEIPGFFPIFPTSPHVLHIYTHSLSHRIAAEDPLTLAFFLYFLEKCLKGTVYKSPNAFHYLLNLSWLLCLHLLFLMSSEE